MANSRPNVQLFGYPVELRDEREVPGFRVRPPEEDPQPPPWMERNRLGIPPELLMDPDLQPFYMDVPGRVLPHPKPWPLRLPGR